MNGEAGNAGLPTQEQPLREPVGELTGDRKPMADSLETEAGPAPVMPVTGRL